MDIIGETLHSERYTLRSYKALHHAASCAMKLLVWVRSPYHQCIQTPWSLICDPDTFRVRAIHSELGLARVGASPGQPADHSSHDKWDKALLKIRRPGPRPRTKWHFNGSVLGFEVNISLTSLLSSTACVTSRLCLWTEASCLYAANQSKSNFPSVNNVIVIKLLTLDKILGFGNPLMNYRYSLSLITKAL